MFWFFKSKIFVLFNLQIFLDLGTSHHNEEELFEIWLQKNHFIRFDVVDFKFLMVPKTEVITVDSIIKYHNIDEVNYFCWNSLLNNSSENTVALKETIWEITKIVKRRKWKNQIQYLLQWKSMNGRVFSKYLLIILIFFKL